MEDIIQQEYLKLLEASDLKHKGREKYSNYKTLLNEDFSRINPRTDTYKTLKKLKEALVNYLESRTLPKSEVLQLTYPDYNKVNSAVRTALQNIVSESYGNEFSEFMNSFENPGNELIKSQTSLFDNVDSKNRYSLYKGFLCFANCLTEYLPKSDEKNSMTYMLYFAIERMKLDFEDKELLLFYEAKTDENKDLHIEDKYKDFLNNCLNKNVRSYNAINNKFKEGFNSQIFLLNNIDRICKILDISPTSKAFRDLHPLITTFFEEVKKVLSSDNLPDLIDGADTWLHRLERQKVKIVPFEVDEELSLAKKFEIALEQAAEYLKHQKREKQREYGLYFEKLLEDGASIDILSTSKSDYQYYRILRDFFQREKINTVTYCYLEFSEKLLSQISEVVKENIYHPKEDLVNALGIEREQIFYLMSKAFYFKAENKANPTILTDKKDEKDKGPVDKNIRCLKKSLQELLFPANKDLILADVEEKVKEDKKEGDFMPDVISTALDTHPMIEQVGEGLYQLKKEELGSAYLIQGRIMYEINDWRTKEEIEKIFKQQFPERKEKFQNHQLSDFKSKVSPSMGFINLGKTGKWRFTEDKNGHEEDVSRILTNLLKKKEIVTLDEVMDCVKENDMPYDRGTIRTYLLGMCHIDETGSVYVLSEKKNKHPEYSWKRKYRGNSTNWTVNRAVEILQQQPNHKMTNKQFKESLLHSAKEEGYRPEIYYIITSYVGEDKLFFRDNSFIELNQDVLEKTDLKFEGLYRKDPYFMDIFSYTFNALSHKEDSQISLSELADRITSQEGVSIEKSTVRHAFDQDAILPDGLERFTVEGSVYVRLVNAKANEDDEQYKVDNSIPSTNEESPTLVVDPAERPVVTYQTVYTWGELRNAMKIELEYYDNWDDDNPIISEASLDKFQKFMENSENSNLRTMIPQDMYDNWFAYTNRFSLYHYFTDLALNFEGLLVDISKRNGKEVTGKGLMEICEEYYPEYYNCIRNRDYTVTRYNKVFKNLHHNRNQICHGNGAPVEMPTIDMMRNLLGYIALYVRTVVKYYKE